jgi:hypothetical protein
MDHELEQLAILSSGRFVNGSVECSGAALLLEMPLCRNSLSNGRSGARYGRCLFGRKSVANTNTNGEPEIPLWASLQRMSIRAFQGGILQSARSNSSRNLVFGIG